MTMDASQIQVEYIASEVFMHDKPVTYHTLSRALSIHVNVAKQVLSEFYSKNNSKLIASWIITGIKNDKLTIQLISNDNLPETLKLFTKIHTVHIYCVYLNKLKLSKYDLALHELNYPLKLSNSETYYKNGMIKGPEVAKIEQPLQQSTPYRSPKKATSTAASTAEKPTRQVKSSGLTSGYVSRKNQKKQEPLIPTKRSKPTADTGYVYKSRKVQDNQPKERVIISHSDDEVMEDVDSQKKSQNTTELEKLFESDFSDDEQKDHNKPAKPDTPDDIEMVDVEESIPGQNSLPNSTEEPDSLPDPLPEAVEEPEETIQTVDEDGYITTARKKTTAKPEPRKATKQRPTLTPANKKDGKKKQASLMSFFGQK